MLHALFVLSSIVGTSTDILCILGLSKGPLAVVRLVRLPQLPACLLETLEMLGLVSRKNLVF